MIITTIYFLAYSQFNVDSFLSEATVVIVIV